MMETGAFNAGRMLGERKIFGGKETEEREKGK